MHILCKYLATEKELITKFLLIRSKKHERTFLNAFILSPAGRVVNAQLMQMRIEPEPAYYFPRAADENMFRLYCKHC
jgi:hypothetical protein